MKKCCSVVVLSLACLCACENQAASHMIGGDKNHSITLVREQRWVWDQTVEQKIVVSRFPECQRRFEIETGKKGAANLELFGVSDLLYVAHQGADWYAIGTEQCQVQKFVEAPANAPGTLLGVFKTEDEKLVFASPGETKVMQ